MEERVHVSQCPNNAQREICFIFPNYCQDPILLIEQTQFCTEGHLVETVLNNLYDIVTSSEKQAYIRWKEKLSESLILTKRALPCIANQCRQNSDTNTLDSGQQTKISSLMAEQKSDNILWKSLSSDLSKSCSSVNFTTSSCLSCTGFDRETVGFQQTNQQPLEEILKARRTCLEAPRQSPTLSLQAEKEIFTKEAIVVEELCDDFARGEDNKDIWKAGAFNHMKISLVKDISLEKRNPAADFINANEPMPVNSTNSINFLSELKENKENKRGSEESPLVVKEVDAV